MLEKLKELRGVRDEVTGELLAGQELATRVTQRQQRREGAFVARGRGGAVHAGYLGRNAPPTKLLR